MKPTLLTLLLAACMSGCTRHPPPGAAMPTPRRCNAEEALFAGGALLHTDDGVDLWYKIAGRADGPPLVYVHGGPCFGAYDFEKTVGPYLERAARVVYFEQRGCLRSAGGATASNVGRESVLEDFERLRHLLGVDKLDLVAHSAGVWVAIEYAHRHPDHVGHVVLVDSSGAFQQSVQQRLDYAASIADRAFPDEAAKVRALAQGARSATPEARLEAFGEAATRIGNARWSRDLYYANAREQEGVDRATAELRRRCFWGEGAAWFVREGYLLSDNPGLMKPLGINALLVAGRQSHVFGPALLEAAAATWQIPLRWIDDAGHFPYAAQPERFAALVLAFIGQH